MDPSRCLGRPIKVFWVDDDAWYPGVLEDYNPSKGWFVQYSDGDHEWLKNLDQYVEFDDDLGDPRGAAEADDGGRDELGATGEPELEIIPATKDILLADNDYDLSDEEPSSLDGNKKTAKSSAGTQQVTTSPRSSSARYNDQLSDDDDDGGSYQNPPKKTGEDYDDRRRQQQHQPSSVSPVLDEEVDAFLKRREKSPASLRDAAAARREPESSPAYKGPPLYGNDESDGDRDTYHDTYTGSQNKAAKKQALYDSEDDGLYAGRRSNDHRSDRLNLDHDEDDDLFVGTAAAAASVADDSDDDRKVRARNISNVPAMKESEEPVGDDEVIDDGGLGLPDRGVLLIGTVFGAAHLPYPERGEADGRSFFRVLYVEGGSQSTLLRCKTPIFNSDLADNLLSPGWSDESGSFRFEMVMPEKSNQRGLMVKAGVSGMYLHGEILVAFYRQRANGGNEFIGQATFDLAEIARSGTTEVHRRGIEARSVSGSFPLLNRLGQIAGDGAEVDVRLELAWKTQSSRPKSAATASVSSGSKVPVKSKRPGTTGSAVAPGTKKAVGVKAPSTKASAAAGGGANKAPGPTLRVSARQRQLMLDQKRIELENKSLRNRVQKVGSKGQVAMVDALYGAQGTVDAAAGAINEVAAASRIEARVKEQVAKERGAKAGSGKPTYEDVLEAHTKLKKEVADIERENQSLKALFSRLKLHVKKYELSTEKLRKDVSHLPPASRRTTARDSSSRKAAPAPSSAAADGDDIDVSKIADSELRDLLIENQGLQELRRTLVERAKNAKANIEKAGERVCKAQGEAGVARRRIEILCPGTVELSEEDRSRSDPKEKLVIQKLRDVKADLATIEAAYINDVHVGPVLDAISENKAVLVTLKHMTESAKREIESARFDRDMGFERGQALAEGNTAFRLRESIAHIRSVLFKLRQRARLSHLEMGSDKIELEILRWNLSRERADASKSSGGGFEPTL